MFLVELEVIDLRATHIDVRSSSCAMGPVKIRHRDLDDELTLAIRFHHLRLPSSLVLWARVVLPLLLATFLRPLWIHLLDLGGAREGSLSD